MRCVARLKPYSKFTLMVLEMKNHKKVSKTIYVCTILYNMVSREQQKKGKMQQFTVLFVIWVFI